MFTEELFNGIKAKGGSGTVYEVKFSMLEIYNEVVRDLLDPKGGQKKGGLKVRQHPKKGFYGKKQNKVRIIPHILRGLSSSTSASAIISGFWAPSPLSANSLNLPYYVRFWA